MAEFVIEGGAKLHGEVVASGNKNAALPLLSCALLTDEPVILHNVPRIRDVMTLMKLMQTMGAQVEWIADNSVRVSAANVDSCILDAKLCKEIRASILLAGPMLARCGNITLPPPGGDVIGRRRVDTHFLALKALGAQVTIDRNFMLRAEKLTGADIMLDEASVTATENAVMAAATAHGTTVLRNAASEPHVQDLCQLLIQMGVGIEGVGSNTLAIHGCGKLKGGEYTIGADYIEVTSFIVLGAVCGGGRGLWIRRASPQHHRMTAMTLSKLGISFDVHGEDIFVPGLQELCVEREIDGYMPTIADSIWPGFPADVMSPVIVAATQARGSVLIHEKMYESRLFWVDKLIGMGAQIVLCDPHRCVVQGISRLRGERIQSPDIRAGMSLVIAALCAEGTSVIGNIEQIDRGYERFEEKLRGLGARIERR
jgi:UDP-N-acetylglucosamine 1-carboxyvinyltransferase